MAPPPLARVTLLALVGAAVGFSGPAAVPSGRRHAPPAASLDALASMSTHYLEHLDNDYFLTTCTQSFALVSAGDVMAQVIEEHMGVREGGVDFGRTVRFGFLGILVSGLGTARWLQFLEEVVGPTAGGDQWAGVVEKVAMDFCMWAPIANAFYIVAVPAVEGEVDLTRENAAALISERFGPAMAAEFCMFVPYDLLAFSLIPPLLRPLTASCVSLCYAVFMSWWSHRRVDRSDLPAKETPPATHLAPASN